MIGRPLTRARFLMVLDDERARDRTYHTLRQRLIAHARAAHHLSPDEADDVVHSAYARCAGLLHKIPMHMWVAYVKRAVDTEVTDRHRLEYRRRQHEVALEEGWDEWVVVTTRSPEDAYLLHELVQNTLDALAEEAPREQLLMALTIMEMPEKEIAVVQGRTYGAVRTALYRLRQRLLARLRPTWGDLSR